MSQQPLQDVGASSLVRSDSSARRSADSRTVSGVREEEQKSAVGQEVLSEKKEQEGPATEEEGEDGLVHINYPSGPALALLTVGLCLVVFVVSIPLLQCQYFPPI